MLKEGEAGVVSLPAETVYAAGGIVSRPLLRTANARLILFGFDKGQELTEHTSAREALVQVLSGECDFSLAGEVRRLKAGDVVYMPANVRHAVQAVETFSMLLTLI